MQVNAISKACYYKFVILVISGRISHGVLAKYWHMPWQHQGWIMAIHTDDTSTKSTKFNYLNGHPYSWTRPSTPALNSLHWFPVIYRSQYKILVCAYKALHGTAPQHSEGLVVMYQPIKSLRSGPESLLNVPNICGVK